MKSDGFQAGEIEFGRTPSRLHFAYDEEHNDGPEDR
jgi:hypothetical protein